MGKNYKKLGVLILIGFLFLNSCSKEEGEDGPNVKETDYSLVSNEAVPGEVVEIKSAKSINGSETDVMINGTLVKAYASGGSSYYFIMPVLASGNYELKMPNLNSDISLKLKVGDYVAITKPEQVINDFLVSRDKCFEQINKIGSSAETLLLIDQIKEEWDYNYSKLTEQDKIQLAYILQKNMLNPELFNAESDPSTSFNKSNKSFTDVGDKLVANAKVFVTVQNVCVGSIPFLIGTGVAFVNAPNFVTAVAFTGVFSVFIVSREVAIIKAKEVGDLPGIPEAIFDVSTQKNAALELAKDVEINVGMKIQFRNLKMSDENIQTDISKAFTEEKKFLDEDNKVKELYEKAIRFTNKLKGLYSGYNSIIGKAPEKSAIVSLSGKDIIVQGSSNSNVKITTSLVGDVRKIKASTASNEDIEFNLKLAYKRAIDGKEIVKEIPCVLKASVSLAGTWTMESFNDGVLIGQYYEQSNEECPSIMWGSYTYLSEVIVFTDSTYDLTSSSRHNYYGKQINTTTCEVTKDSADTQETINDTANGTYILTGNTIQVTSQGYTMSGGLVFLSPNKIKLGDNVYVKQ